MTPSSLSSRGSARCAGPAGSRLEAEILPLDTAVEPRYDIAPRHDYGNQIRRRGRSARGFTLLEVMIALLVIALGIGAVINTTSESGWKSAQLRQKTIASWVAQNQIAAYRARRTWDNKSNLSGEAIMANANWPWKMRIVATDDPDIRRIEIDVYLKGEDGIKASMTSAIARL